MGNSTGSPIFSDFKSDLSKIAHFTTCSLLRNVGKALQSQHKTCSHKDPVLSLMPDSGTGTAGSPNFGVGYLEKVCSHWCSAWNRTQAPCPGTRCEYCLTSGQLYCLLNQSKSILFWSFRELLVSTSLHSKERRLKVQD